MGKQAEERGLELVQGVLEGQKSILDAARELLPLLRMIPLAISQDDFDLLRAIESETDDLPIGQVRAHWRPDALPEKDREINRFEGLWRDRMLLACQRIRKALLVRKLVVNRHLNVAERQIVGAVARQEVADVLKSILLTEGVFPMEGREGIAYEGAVLGLVSLGVQVTLSRNDPSNPQVVAECRIDHYRDIDAAIETFINIEWCRGIDGIPLERHR